MKKTIIFLLKNKMKKNIIIILLASVPSLIVIALSHYNFPLFIEGFKSSYDGNFVRAARQILETGNYSGLHNFPLYPYVVALIFKVFGSNTLYPIIMNAFFHGLTAFLLANISKKFNFNWFYPTLIITSLWPHLLWRTTYLYAETFFTLMIVTSLFFIFIYFEKKKIYYLFLSSVFLGLSVITKSANIFVLFILPLFLFFLFYKKIKKNIFHSFKLVLIYVFTFTIIFSFQVLRIYKETGYIGYSTSSGFVLLDYVYPCLQTKFGCGVKDRNAIDKVQELFNKKMIDAKYPDSINPYYEKIVKKDIAIKLIKETDLKQIFIATFGGYTKFFLHNFTYDVFRRLEIKSTHLSDFTGSLYTKAKLMLKKIIYEDRLMLFWLFSQIILIFSRAIQVIGLYNLLFSKKNIYEFLLLSMFFVPILFSIIAMGTIRYRIPFEPFLIILTISGLFYIIKHLRKT